MESGLLGATTIKQASRLMKANVFTAPELVEATYANIKKLEHLNAYVAVRPMEEAVKEAEESQKRIERSKSILTITQIVLLFITLMASSASMLSLLTWSSDLVF